ncbi:hypothetical protein [Pedobacter zeae]|uniref:Uncharacterized protein n=1 Tax=Pedobacter zeae TaxID=1737356 RepID=A0A7W6P5T6_9SPHI|nr:hypothetical protein [Pedobacter zeae]MBB4108143.1 hypothetical protein [Pedobacter zeae]GGG94710.1 hypothetical protein GCM10007422_05220 [Pedobacter zeae]
MASSNISNIKALKGYKRFSEFSKLLLAGFSAILFFSYDKIDCDGLKLAEGILAAVGIVLSGAALMGYARAADHIELEIDSKSDAPLLLAAYKNANAQIDKYDKGFYWTAIALLAISASLFIASPFICGKQDKTEKVKNVIKTYQHVDQQDSAGMPQKKVTVAVDSINCKKVNLITTCGCVDRNDFRRSSCSPKCRKAIQNGRCSCKQ